MKNNFSDTKFVREAVAYANICIIATATLGKYDAAYFYLVPQK